MSVPLVPHVLFAAVTLAMAEGIAIADQEYPNRAITVVVPLSAGGAVDVIARVLGQHASRTLGQPIVVENVTGAGGTIAATRVARAVSLGLTLGMCLISAAIAVTRVIKADPAEVF
jgi:tripartite-type tricarboxylate transporter receptor subunit TctC